MQDPCWTSIWGLCLPHHQQGMGVQSQKRLQMHIWEGDLAFVLQLQEAAVSALIMGFWKARWCRFAYVCLPLVCFWSKYTLLCLRQPCSLHWLYSIGRNKLFLLPHTWSCQKLLLLFKGIYCACRLAYGLYKLSERRFNSSCLLPLPRTLHSNGSSSTNMPAK